MTTLTKTVINMGVALNIVKSLVSVKSTENLDKKTTTGSEENGC